MVFGTHQSEAKTHKLNFKHTSFEINDFNDLSDWIQFFRLPASHEATGNSMKEVKEHQWLFNQKKQQPRQSKVKNSCKWLTKFVWILSVFVDVANFTNCNRGRIQHRIKSFQIKYWKSNIIILNVLRDSENLPRDNFGWWRQPSLSISNQTFKKRDYESL